MELTGKVIFVSDVQTIVSKSGKSWIKKDYTIRETEGTYPQTLCFVVFGEEKIQEFDIKLNDVVKVLFNANANEHKGRWYNQMVAWRVTKIDDGEKSYQPQVTQVKEETKTQVITQKDDLPF